VRDSSTPYRLIPPSTLATLGSLELVARTVVDGFMYGAHPSRMAGAGIEFSQYRSYQPGDDLRRVDWKLFGRSDRYFVRESESETSVTVQLVLDASGSMAGAESGVSRLDYGRFVAAALALLAHRQGDATSLHLVRNGELVTHPAQRGQRHLHRLLHSLEQATAEGAWPPWSTLEGPLSSGGRAITVFISDVHERADEIRTAIAHLSSLRHDVALVHLVGREELEFPYAGPVTFEELETGRTVEVDADSARPAYLASVARALDALAGELAERPIVYLRSVTDQPVDEVLRAFSALRRRS
jgi:uncharacterized protein (DUF58 family)